MNDDWSAEVDPPLLAGFERSECRALLALAASQQVPANTVLCRQAEPGEFAFVVRSGRVRMARSTDNGAEILVRWLTRGDCFGLVSLVPGHVNYMATSMTADETTLYVWKASAIQAAAVTHPMLSQNALRIALQYLEELAERHAALLSHTAEQRLARAINHLGATSGNVLPTGVEIEVTNQDLAGLSDVGMFTVSRQLKIWERAGHLLKRRRRVLIRHPEALLGD